MTNAHNMAGAVQPTVQINGRTVPARVVAFDPAVDIAILKFSGTPAPRLDLSGTGFAGESVALIGYPDDGTLAIEPGNILKEIRLRSHTIYGEGTVLRDVFELHGVIRPGDSGDPVVSSIGEVVGVAFASSTKSPSTGYALSSTQVAAFLKYAGTQLNGEPWPTVSAGNCHL